MTLDVDAILFDADGVLQTTEEKWFYEFSGLIGSSSMDQVTAFFEDLRTTERPSLSSVNPFLPHLRELLDRWHVTVPADDVLAMWHHIEVDEKMITAVRELSAAGTRCALATNQHVERATYMQEHLGYGELFERTFYSCEMGAAKPDPDYFRHALRELDLPAERVLFIDDNADNVAGAQQLGLRAELFDRYGSRTELERILARHQAQES